jgi:shikimate dehydrogenase
MSERYGLIGKNIGFSKSPKIHKFMSKYLGIDITYDLLDVEEQDLSHLIKHLRSGLYKGFNVTIPYKQTMMNLVDELTNRAKRIQAINTLYLRNGKVIGDNTDYDGFMGLLRTNQVEVKDKRVFILGNGGAAKAAYVALSDMEAKVTVVSRKITDLDSMFKRVVSYEYLNPKDVDIYIQATPMGTYPNVKDSILPKEHVANKTVIDLVYNPEITQIMKYSKRGIGGLNMLIIQAIKSEEIWFGRKIDLTDELITQLKEVIYHE